MAKAKPSLTEREIFAALQARYRPPEWALLPQVANGTGYGANSWIDARARRNWARRSGRS